MYIHIYTSFTLTYNFNGLVQNYGNATVNALVTTDLHQAIDLTTCVKGD